MIGKRVAASKQRNAILEISRRLEKDMRVMDENGGLSREFVREEWCVGHAMLSPKGKQMKVLCVLFSDMLLFATAKVWKIWEKRERE